MEALMDADQVARLLATSKQTVWRLARSGELPVVNITTGSLNTKTSRRMRFTQEAVRTFIEERKSSPGQ